MLDHLSLTGKFVALTALACTIFLASGLWAWRQIDSTSQAEMESIARWQVGVAVVKTIDGLSLAFQKEVGLAKEIGTAVTGGGGAAPHRDEFMAQRQAFAAHHAEALQGLRKLAQEQPGLDGFIRQLGSLADQHRTLSDRYLAEIDAQQGNAYASDPAVAEIDEALAGQITTLRSGLIDFLAEQTAASSAHPDGDRPRQWPVILLGVMLGLLPLSVLLLGRSVTHQLGGDPKDLIKSINAMAAGDIPFSPRHAPRADGPLAKLLLTQSALREGLAKVRGQAGLAGDTAHDLAYSALHLADNLQLEANAMADMTAAIDAVSGSAQAYGDQGERALRSFSSGRANAEHGARAVTQITTGLITLKQEIRVVAAEMARLSEDAARINDLAKVIGVSAEQTHLLALNAAIQASRSGARERDGAPLAEQVRNFAERTRAAAAVIEQLSGNLGSGAVRARRGAEKAIANTQQGLSQAEAAKNTVAGIQQNFADAATVVDEISTALTERRTATAQLALSREGVSYMTQENTTAGKNLARLATDLEGKTDAIRQALAVFSVYREDRSADTEPASLVRKG